MPANSPSKQNDDSTEDSAPKPGKESFRDQQTSLFITQENISPSAIKQRHLVSSPSQKGMIYYGKDGNSFSALSIGTTGQILTVVAGVPAWSSFPRTGVAASRPSSGRFTGDMYFSTDTFVLSAWTGSAWKTTTLT